MQLASSVYQLYELDFRVRTFICQSLMAIAHDDQDERSGDAAQELEFCLKIGFGTFEQSQDQRRVLQASPRCSQNLELEIQKITDMKLCYSSQAFVELLEKGLVLEIGADYYEHRGLLDDAYKAYQVELSALSKVFGDNSDLAILLGDMLAKICMQYQKPIEAEALYTKHVSIFTKRLGQRADEDPDMIHARGNLALAIRDQPNRSAEAETLLLRLLEEKQVKDQSDEANGARNMGNLALLYKSRGQYSKAAGYFKQAMETLKERLGIDHPLTLQTATNLIQVNGELGDMAGIDALLQGILVSYKKQFGSDHVSTILAMVDVADVYEKINMFDESMSRYRQALESSEQGVGPHSLMTMGIVSKFAQVCFQAGRKQDAKREIRRLLDWHGKQTDLERPFKSGAIIRLLPHHNDGENPSDTETLYKFILDGLNKYLGASHEWTQKVLQNYLCTYLPRERLKEAEEMCKRVLSRQSSSHPAGSEDVAMMTSTKLQLGTVYEQQGRLSDAARIWKETRQELLDNSGPRGAKLLSCLRRLATMYLSETRDEEALEYLGQALEVAKGSLGLKHATTLEIRAQLSLHYLYQDRRAESNAMYSQARTVLEEVGFDDMVSLTVMFNLAEVDRIARRHCEADVIYHRALPMFERECGADGPETLEIKHSMGLNLVRMGSVRDGEPLLMSVLDAKERVLGPHHPNTVKLVNQLQVYFKENHRYVESFKMWTKAPNGANRWFGGLNRFKLKLYKWLVVDSKA